MNRALIIIICDFLLVSVLSIARFEIREDTPADTAAMTPDYSGGDRDLVEVLSFALEEERHSREELLDALAQSQERVQSQEEILRQREEMLRDREGKIEEVQASLQRKEEETRRLDEERTALQEQFVSTRENLERAEQQLSATSSDARLSRERLQMLQAELLARQEAAARMQRQIEELERARHLTESEKLQLATELQKVEVETRLVREQLDSVRGEVQIVRDEKSRIQEHATKLADGVSQLAEKSGELTAEIRENRPLAANTIFHEFVSNRINTRFQGMRTGFLGRTVEWQRETQSVLVTDGFQIFAIYHIQDTPLNLGEVGTNWQRLTGTVARQSQIFAITQLGMLSSDPRIAVIPVGEAPARKLGSKVYSLASDPFKFGEAVLVGASEDYYGECRFQLDSDNPKYVRMERSLFSRITGKFSPSSGDLVFSKTGELLGIMVNNEYCLVLDNFKVFRSVRTGNEMAGQPTGQMISEVRAWRDRLPMKLQ